MTTLSHRQRIETQFVELMAELFQLDDAQALDFGLYRVIRRHNREVRSFLGEIVSTSKDTRTWQGGKLGQLLDEAFSKADDETTAAERVKLARIESGLGLKPGMTEAVRTERLAAFAGVPATKALVDDYHALKESLAGSDTAEHDRAEVLNRLYQFFSRHYQDGDFIVERRYGKGGSRYIRSTGEDTEFHWATEDMYYIKSGDIFTDYPVRLANGQRIVFAVDGDSLQATRATLKPNDKAHYEFAAIEPAGDHLSVRLKYLKGAQTDKQREDIVARIHARTGGDPADIKRWLRRYIARNQSDFFIHKRLREVLADDLDIFIKSEVLDTDQLLVDKDLSRRVIKVGRIVRHIGLKIIDFLAALEDFQKALWEKKKLVFETRYVITLDRLQRYCPAWLEQHVDAIVAGQRAEWQALGLGDYSHAAACRRETACDLATPAAVRYLPLPVDSGNFEPVFKWDMLGAVTTTTDLDDALDGVAIHSDNWQALNTLQAKYREQVKCIYIDPPYNTNSSGIPYKNGYRHASYAALINDRVDQLHRFLPADGAIFVSIDKTERTVVEQVLNSVFGADNRIEELIWAMNTNNSQAPNYSTNHEYVLVYARHRPAVEQDKSMFREPKPGFEEVMALVAQMNPDYPPIATIEASIRALYEEHRLQYRSDVEAQGLDLDEEKDNDPWRGLYNYCHAEYRDADGRLVSETEARAKKSKIWIWREDNISMPATKQAESTRDPQHPNYRFYQPLHPATRKPCPHPKSGWKFAYADDAHSPEKRSLQALARDHRVAWGEDEIKIPQLKRMLHEVESNVGKSVFRDYSDGEKQTSAMFGKSGMFLAPKHTDFASRFILQGSKADSIVLDCFGGSGSTAHAVMNINRQERSRRKFVAVEVNRYFETLIVPRLKKAAAAIAWAAGKAKALDGAGVFMKIQVLEQYEDTLENLAIDPLAGDSEELFADNQALALRYRLDHTSRSLYCAVEHFASPFGYQLKRVEGEGEAPMREVDLVESMTYLLGVDIARLFREAEGVVMTGTNRRGQSVAIIFRDCEQAASAQWVKQKLAAHPADRVFTNAPADLSFPGCERLEAIEAVFAQQFGRA